MTSGKMSASLAWRRSFVKLPHVSHACAADASMNAINPFARLCALGDLHRSVPLYRVVQLS